MTSAPVPSGDAPRVPSLGARQSTYSGLCFVFRVGVFGRPAVGKSASIASWAASGVMAMEPPPPPPAHQDPASSFVPACVVVRNCLEASGHRVFLFDCPGGVEYAALRDNIVANGNLDGAVILLGSDDTVEESNATLQVMAACRDRGIHIMQLTLTPETEEERFAAVVRSFEGELSRAKRKWLTEPDAAGHSPPPDVLSSTSRPASSNPFVRPSPLNGSFASTLSLVDRGSTPSARGSGRPRRGAGAAPTRMARTFLGDVGATDFYASYQCLVEFIAALHVERERKADEERERQRRLAMEQEEREVAATKGEPMPPAPRGAVLREGIDPAATWHFCIALGGAPAAGKSTFLCSALDKFSLEDYEPTRRLETGTCHVVLPRAERGANTIAELDDAMTINVSLLDGPLGKHSDGVCYAIVFVDISEEDFGDTALHAMEAFKELPGLLYCIKADVLDRQGLIVPMEEIEAIAGSCNWNYVISDARKVPGQSDLVCAIVASLTMRERRTAYIMKHQLALRAERCEALAAEAVGVLSIPCTEAALRRHFHRYDVEGSGFIEPEDAEAIYNEFDRTGLGDARQVVRSIMMESKHDVVTFDDFGVMMCRLARQ